MPPVVFALLCLILWPPSPVHSQSGSQTLPLGGTETVNSSTPNQIYTPPSFCSDLTCPAGAFPSSFFYFDSFGTCNCSAPLSVTLLVHSTEAANFSTDTATQLREALAARFTLATTQVWVTFINTTADSKQALAGLQFFPGGPDPWTLGQVAILLATLETNQTLLVPSFGLSSVTTSSFGSPVDVPSPPPPQITGPPRLPSWAIGYIAIGALLLLLGAGLLLWRFLGPRQKEVNWYKNPLSTARPPPKLPEKTLPRSQSSFVQKVQEYFVKEIQLDEICKATDNFSEQNVLGVGGYGTVYKGIATDGAEWAVKRAKKKADTGVEDFENEVDVISKMSHRNLVRLLGYCAEQNEQILVYEYVPNGNLREHIQGAERFQGQTLSFQQRLEIAIGAAEGLRYLHSFAKPPIIHRDVKSDNILLDNEMQAKVADFGVFKHLQTSVPPGSTVNTKVVGTPGYLDPEYYQSYKVTPKSDVYSFGVVLLELITGHPSIMADPASGSRNVMITLARWAMPKIAAGKVDIVVDPKLDAAYPRQALQMLGSVAAMCVRRSGRERPEMAEVATRLNEIKYFLQPSSGLLEPVGIEEDLDALGAIPEFIPGAPTESSIMTGSSVEQNTAPVSMVFSDR